MSRRLSRPGAYRTSTYFILLDAEYGNDDENDDCGGEKETGSDDDDDELLTRRRRRRTHAHLAGRGKCACATKGWGEGGKYLLHGAELSSLDAFAKKKNR